MGLEKSLQLHAQLLLGGLGQDIRSLVYDLAVIISSALDAFLR